MSRRIVLFSLVGIMIIAAAAYAVADVNGLTQRGGHFPTSVGIKYVWAANSADVPVTISFTGPWNFTTGPKDRTIVSEIVDKTTAYNYANYPLAAFALKESGGGEPTVYRFFRKANNGIVWYGNSSPTSAEDTYTLSIPIRRIFFPAKVNVMVTQRTNIIYPNETVPLTMQLRYVGQGVVTVGAGTFNDTVMLQTKATWGGSSPKSYILYNWIAPYLGSVAQIISLENETNEQFTTASYFYWAKTVSVP
ncbi:MAG: hypothetical protein AB1714_09240 [Acidobacteriota bacterium]